MSGKRNQTINLSGYEAIVDALNTITIEEPEEVKEDQMKEPSQEQPVEFQFNTDKPERKTKRLQLLIKPSTYKTVKKIADKNKLSVNDLMNQLLDAFIKGNLK